MMMIMIDRVCASIVNRRPSVDIHVDQGSSNGPKRTRPDSWVHGEEDVERGLRSVVALRARALAPRIERRPEVGGG